LAPVMRIMRGVMCVEAEGSGDEAWAARGWEHKPRSGVSQ